MRTTWTSTVLALALLAACNRERVCPSDQRDCDGRCVAIATDTANCGACGVACRRGEICEQGECRCNGVDCGGACADLASDPAHCGACDFVCEAPQVCTRGETGVPSCADSCGPATLTDCDRACVDLEGDEFHCGACGRACGTNERCDGGRCVADLYVACFNSGELREATSELEPAGTPRPVPPGPLGLAWLDSELFVVSAGSGGAEKIHRARFDPPRVRVQEIGLAHSAAQPDLEYIAAHEGLLYVSHTSVGTLLVLKPNGAVVDEIPLRAQASDPTNPNPQGIAFVGGKAYVALNGSDEVAVLDVKSGCTAPPCATISKRIGVGGLASAGAIARPSRLAAATNGRLFVTLWNLDAFFSVPEGGTGRLAVIDTTTDALDPTVKTGELEGVLDLGTSCLNPADLAVQGEVLYVTCGAFDFDVNRDPPMIIKGSGILPIDLSEPPQPRQIVPMASPEEEAPGKLAFCDGTGYVADRNSGKVFQFDPDAGSVSAGSPLCPAVNGFAYVSDLVCGP